MKNKKSVLIFILVVILIAIIGLVVYKVVNKSTKTEEKVDNNTVEKDDNETEVAADIYGYSIMKHEANDESRTGSYKIVELHENSDDKTIVTYDVQVKGATDKENSISNINIIGGKLYYILNYNTDDEGFFNYSSLMYIDLTKKGKPVEVLSTKNMDNEYCRMMVQYNVVDDYAYIGNSCDEWYKYDINSKKFDEIKRDEFVSIDESKLEFKHSNIDKLYIDGKVLSTDNSYRELLYDGKTIYTSSAGDITLLYSFDKEIAIEIYTGREGEDFNSFKYYKYNSETSSMDEITLDDNELYEIDVIYK